MYKNQSDEILKLYFNGTFNKEFLKGITNFKIGRLINSKNKKGGINIISLSMYSACTFG